MPRNIENALTNKGVALISKSIAGGFPVQFTKALLGTGVVGDGVDLKTMTALITPHDNASIAKRSVGADGTLVISCQYVNTGVTESIHVDEIGIFAADPDDGEILFSYLTFGQFPDLILKAEDAAVQRVYDVPFVFGAGDTVSVTIVPSGWLASSEVVDDPSPGKLLRMNGAGKLPGDITGDAATLGGVAPDGYALKTHDHPVATSGKNGFMSKEDKQSLTTLGNRVNQGLTAADKPTFAGITVNGYIDGAQFR